MNEVPDDVLRLLFEAYVHDLKCSPAGLLTVNRQWHAVLLSTITLWTRVTINIDSFDVIPYITQATNIGDDQKGEAMDGMEVGSGAICPLRSYLDRSCSTDGSVQLRVDIQIRWFPHENYKSPSDPTTKSATDFLPFRRYDLASFLPYFTSTDRRGCYIQMQLLLLSLAGVYIQVTPFEDESEEVQVQIGADLTAEKEAKVEKIGFDQLELVLNDIRKYAALRFPHFTPELEYCTTFLARNDTLRWRSFTVDLLPVAGSGDISLPTDILINLGRGQLTSLEDITLKGVYMDFRGPKVPSLRYLEIIQSTTTSSFNVDTLRVLKIGRGALKANRHYLLWGRLQSLHTLEIMDPVETDELWWQEAMEQLETLFTESHPLASFSISPQSISDIIDLFNWYPQFRVKALNIASQCLDSLEISTQVITEAHSMLQEMKREGIEVLSLDAKMQNILELARVDEGVIDH